MAAVRSTVPLLTSMTLKAEEMTLSLVSWTRSRPSAKSNTRRSPVLASVEVTNFSVRSSASPICTSLTTMTNSSTPSPKLPCSVISPAFGALRVNVLAAMVPCNTTTKMVPESTWMSLEPISATEPVATTPKRLKVAVPVSVMVMVIAPVASPVNATSSLSSVNPNVADMASTVTLTTLE